MLESSSRASFDASKLVRILSQLVATERHVTHEHFSERLGRLIDFSGSIALSEAHSGRSKSDADASGNPGDDQTPISSQSASDRFLRARAAMVKNLIKRFVPPETHASIEEVMRSPFEEITEKSQAFPPYQAFYHAQQNEMAARVNRLQSDIREIAYGCSSEIATLAALDQALGDAIAARTRKFYAVIPQLLAKRFAQLQSADQTCDENAADAWLQVGGGYDQFCREMRDVLLAELDTRLQPVLGLVETIIEAEKDKVSHD